MQVTKKNVVVSVLVGVSMLALTFAAVMILLVGMGVVVPGNPTVIVPTISNAPDAGVDLPMVASDLSGTWVAENNGATFTAEIVDNTISVTMSRADTSMLYWYGWFDPNALSGDTVVSNKLDIDKPVLSQVDIKQFSIGDGVMTFDFTAMGNTTTVELSRA